jgi:uncharacterized membrane protein
VRALAMVANVDAILAMVIVDRYPMSSKRGVYFFYMELLLIIALGVTCWVLSSRISNLQNRLTHMERYLAESTKGLADRESAQSSDGTVRTPMQSVPARKDLTPNTLEVSSGEPGHIEKFFAWCATDWLMKLGGLLVLLGMGWFVSYAFLNNWIGPMGRIALGLIIGAGVLILGRYRLERYVTQGAVLMFVGAVTIVLTVYSAREVYDFFSPTSALIIMFLTSALLGLTAVSVPHKPLAYGNALLSGLSPFLVASPEPNLVGLFAYLLVVAISTLLVVAYTGWRELVLVSLLVTSLYSSQWILGYGSSAEYDAGLMYAFVFTALFFGASILAMRRVPVPKFTDLLIAIGSGMFLLSWVLVAGAPEWQSVLLVVWTLVFSVGAWLAVQHRGNAGFFYAYAGVGVTLLGVATGIELDGPALTVATIIQATLILVIGHHLTRNAHHVPILALPFLIPLLQSFESMDSNYWYVGIIHEHSAIMVLMIAMLALIGSYFEEQKRLVGEAEGQILGSMRNIAWTLAGLYLAVFTWLAMHALFVTEDGGTTATLFLYTLTASVMFMRAQKSGLRWQRMTAITLLAFVVGRLLLVEVWSMALAGRIVTFLGIGVVLIVVAWLERSAVRSVSTPITNDTQEHHD